MPVAPFRVFGVAARPSPLPAGVVLLWNRVLVQSISPAEVPSSLLRWSRYAVSPCLGCAVFLQRAAAGYCLGDRLPPLFELHLPLEYYPATPTRPPRRSGPLMGFGSLQHMKNSRSTHRGLKPTRYVPSSGFGYPLDGLLPRIPGRFYFAPAALMGFALRRIVPSRGFPGLSTWKDPPTVALVRLFRRRSVRPARRPPVTGSVPLKVPCGRAEV